MKIIPKVIIVITLYVSTKNCYAQAVQSYRELISIAMESYRSKNYSEANKYFELAFKIETSNKYELFNGACIASLDDDIATAFTRLDLAIKNGWTDIYLILTDPNLDNLRNTKEFSKRYSKQVENIKIDLNNYLINIQVEDQEIRDVYSKYFSSHGVGSPEIDSVMVLMNNLDNLHRLSVDSLVGHNWPKLGSISSQAFSALFLVVQHSPLEYQKKYFNRIRESAKSGAIPMGSIALLKDRMLIAKKRKQKYGTQIGYNKNSKASYVLPLRNPSKVDKRRSKLGLGKMEAYTARYGLNWSEEYERLIK